MNAGVEFFGDGFATFEVSIDDRFHIFGLDLPVPGFFRGDAHAGAGTALSQTPAWLHADSLGNRLAKGFQDLGRSLLAAGTVLTDKHAGSRGRRFAVRIGLHLHHDLEISNIYIDLNASIQGQDFLMRSPDKLHELV